MRKGNGRPRALSDRSDESESDHSFDGEGDDGDSSSESSSSSPSSSLVRNVVSCIVGSALGICKCLDLSEERSFVRYRWNEPEKYTRSIVALRWVPPGSFAHDQLAFSLAADGMYSVFDVDRGITIVRREASDVKQMMFGDFTSSRHLTTLDSVKGTLSVWKGFDFLDSYADEDISESMPQYQEDFTRIAEMETGIRKPRCAHLHRTSNQFASGGDEQLIQIWDIEAQKLKWKFRNVSNDNLDLAVPIRPRAVQFMSNNPNNLIELTGDGDVRFYDQRKRQPNLSRKLNKESGFRCLDIDSADACFAAGDLFGNVSIYDLRKLHEPVRVLTGSAGTIRSVCFHPTARHMVFATGLDRYARVYSIHKKKSIGKIYIKQKQNLIVAAEREPVLPEEEEKEDEDSIRIRFPRDPELRKRRREYERKQQKRRHRF